MAGGLAAQTEPEFGGVFFRLNQGALQPLERERSGLSTSVGLGAKSKLEIAGNRSDIRFQSSDPLEFVVRNPLGKFIDPDTIYHLRKLDQKKHTRESVSMTVSVSKKIFIPIAGIALASASAHTIGGLPLSFARYGKESVRISVGALPPGEYVLMSGFTGLIGPDQAVYCFGID